MFELIPHILTIPILSPFLFIPSLYASFLKFVGFFYLLVVISILLVFVLLEGVHSIKAKNMQEYGNESNSAVFYD